MLAVRHGLRAISSSLRPAGQLRALSTTPYGEYTVLKPPRRKVVNGPPLSVPEGIWRPGYVAREGGKEEDGPHDVMISLGSEDERAIREAGRLAAEVMERVPELVKPGVTTNAIDRAVHAMIVERGAYPSPLGYQGYPKSITTSVNNQICHGIPDDRPLEPADIVNVDLTLFTRAGMHGDTSLTLPVSASVDGPGRALIGLTRAALEAGIRACGPGVRFREIGRAIEDTVRAEEGFVVNRQFVGHAIGRRFHSAPWILPYTNDEPGMMLPGHCFTIEPCIVEVLTAADAAADPSARIDLAREQGHGFLWPDGWTMSTTTGARSAQAEHMVLITETGAEVLTRRSGERR